MKIAILVPSLLNKGPISVVQDIVNSLKPDVKQHVEVLYFDEEKELSFDCKTIRVNFNKPINFDSYTVIHSHGIRPDLYMWRFRKRFKGKHIATLHSYIHKDLSFTYNKLLATFFSKLWLFFLKKADHIVVLSNHMYGYYSKYIDQKKLLIIRNGRNVDATQVPDQEDIVQLRELRKKFHVLGSICAISKLKGIDQVLMAMVNISKVALVVVGEGAEKQHLIQQAKELNLEDRVFFLGYKPNGFRYLAMFDTFLMVSRSEGFPLSLIEAAAYKKPCICSNLPVFLEEYETNEVCFFELENKQSLITAIDEVVENGDTYGATLHHKYLTTFTAQIMSSRYLDLYTE